MRLSSLLGTGFVLVALSASGALAQNSRPDIALSTSPYGIMSCGKFLALGPGDRDSIVRKMIAMAPASSLTSTSVNAGVTSSDELVQQEDDATLPPLSSGQLISACQAINAGSTLREAYSHSNIAPQIVMPDTN